MFQPTHWLVSRSTKTPVQLVPATGSYGLMREQEFDQGRDPAFEIRPRLGVFCHGVLVLGYTLEPMPVPASTLAAQSQDCQSA